jgi:hypothetical protein
MSLPRSIWLAITSLVVVAVGAYGPWAQRFGLGANGSDDEFVGIIALVAALALVIFVVTRNRRWATVPLFAGLLCAMLIGHDLNDPAGPFGGPGPNIHWQWGIWVALAGSIGLVLGSVALLAEIAGVSVGRRRLTPGLQPRSRPLPRAERPSSRQPRSSAGKHGRGEREARRRRESLIPQLRSYGSLDRVLWPIVTATAKPNFTSPVVTTDRRGHRITRVRSETARSDEPPVNAAFLLGGSYAFGVGASDDSRTLAAALWRRTRTPYVNLGIRAANSAQELVSVLPFADRETTFFVCSGLNNLSTARGAAGLDPLFGPMHHEAQLRRLASVSIARLSRLAVEPLTLFEDDELRRELRRRRGRRLRTRFPTASQLEKRVRGRFSSHIAPPTDAPPPEEELDENAIMTDAAARQVRDLSLLRGLVPHKARVLFALQPLAPYTGKRLSPEEEELFALLDVLQPNRWPELSHLLETQWGTYAGLLKQGCAEVGVPFIDLGQGKYEGWCFIDRIHSTDRGYDTAAELLEEALSLEKR